MPPEKIYRHEDPEYPGYGAAVAGNYIEIVPHLNGYYASVQAYDRDTNFQGQAFDNPTDAADWAIAAAQNHQGSAAGAAVHPAVRWEIHDGCSISAIQCDDGRYEAGWQPLWVGDDRLRPYHNDNRQFDTIEAALEHARAQADQWNQMQQRRDNKILGIRTALEQALASQEESQNGKGSPDRA